MWPKNYRNKWLFTSIKKELSDSLYLNEIDSFTADEHQYRGELPLVFTFTEDSAKTTGGVYKSYSIRNDTLKLQYINPRFELIDDILRIEVGSIVTGSSGALKYEYDEWWMFDRM